MAVHARELAREVSVWARREESRATCLEAPWCQAASGSLKEAMEGAGLAVLCTPVAHLSEILGQIHAILPANCILTDVGSTKGTICQVASESNIDSFVGSHPIAGSEKTGVEHARADLFEGRPCFITPSEDTHPDPLEKVTAFWQSLDMQIIRCSPQEHDRILSQVSHLPHFLASALCNVLAKQPLEWKEGSGQGLRDATRIAAGSPTLWRDVAQQNKEEILAALDLFDKESKNLRHILEVDDWEALHGWLREGKVFRDSLE
jgi:prephenate dehydrogenase